MPQQHGDGAQPRRRLRSGAAPRLPPGVLPVRTGEGVQRLQGAAGRRPRQPLDGAIDRLVAEVAHAFSHEYAVTLGDALLRRVPIALGECWSDDCAAAAAGRVGEALGWTEKRIAREYESLMAERASFLKSSAVPAPVS